MANKIDLVEIHTGGNYGSEFETDSESERQRSRKESFKGLVPKKKKTIDGVASKHELEKEYSKEEGRTHRFKILSLDAFSRHKQFVNNYLLYYGGSRKDFKRDSSCDKTDMDVIREHHRFLWQEGEETEDSWEKRLAKKYYDKLFREYGIADLSRYKENQVGMRWRTEKEVVDGKGQFTCGNKKCSGDSSLRTWEVNFAYVEKQEKKNALVKLRLCPDCSYKLNYHHRRKEVTKEPLTKRKAEEQPKEHFKKPRCECYKSESPNEESPEEERKAESWESESPDEESPEVQRKAESWEGESPNEEFPEEERKAEAPSGSGQSPGSQPLDTDSELRSDPSVDQASQIWKGPAKVVEDKSRGEEFEDYFEGMFL